MSVLESIVPSVINAGMQYVQNEQNYARYEEAQAKANAFARRERQESQVYNSLQNQFAQMANVGLNPNLMNGQMFQATSPVQNQSVSPPQGVAPSVPVDSLAQSKLAQAESSNFDANTATEDLLRNGKLTLQNATIVNEWTKTDLMKSEEYLNEDNRKLIFRQIQNLEKSCGEIEARTKQIQSQTKGQDIQNEWQPRISNAEYKRLVSEVATNQAQAQMFLANKEHILALAYGVKLENKLFHDTYQNRVHQFQYDDKTGRIQIGIMRTVDDKFKFELGQAKSYDDYHQMLSLANSTMDLVGKIQNANPVERQMKTGRETLGSFTSPSVSGNTFGSGW